MFSKRIIKFVSISVIFLFACRGGYSQGVKSYEFAGDWYPENPKTLRSVVKRYIEEAEVSPVEGQILGVISPHAGYRYSGSIAGHSFRALRNTRIDTLDTVIVMATTHAHDFSGVSLYPQGEFETPIGNLKIDSKIAKELETLEFVKSAPTNFYRDHTIEMELPFLVELNPKIKIVPMMFGYISYEQLGELAQRLYEISLHKDFVIVVSADLSHYQPYDEAVRIDSDTIDLIERLDTRTLWDTRYFGQGRTCSMPSVVTLLNYVRLKGGVVKKLRYANSGDTSGIKGSVVGYVSALAYIPGQRSPVTGYQEKKNIESEKKEERGMKEFDLTDNEKKFLLKIARATLRSYLKEGKTPSFEPETENLKTKRGAFVTLKKHGRLQGCIGRMAGDTPLYKLIPEYAVNAATEDPRFPGVKYDDLKDIEIEISVLTPFVEVKDLDEIEVGKHGLMIQKGFNSGVLLPQVPGEWGWDKKTFLEQLCLKAGLYPNAYKEPGTIIYKYSAIVFSESEYLSE